MKIAIISDTHDNLANLQKALAYFAEQKAQALIHAGDLEHSDTLDLICKKFHGDIYYIGGNADMDTENIRDLTKIYNHLKYYADSADLLIDGFKIGVTHKPAEANDLAKSGKFQLVIHGHTHKPWQTFVNGCEVLNPGNIAGIHYAPTCALYDTISRRADLIILDKIK